MGDYIEPDSNPAPSAGERLESTTDAMDRLIERIVRIEDRLDAAIENIEEVSETVSTHSSLNTNEHDIDDLADTVQRVDSRVDDLHSTDVKDVLENLADDLRGAFGSAESAADRAYNAI